MLFSPPKQAHGFPPPELAPHQPRGFSEEIWRTARARSQGRCQCVCSCWHHAPGACHVKLIPGFEMARRIHEGRPEDSYELANCEFLCMPCAWHLQAHGFLQMEQV